MRLPIVESGHAWREWAMLKAIRVVSGHPPADVVKTLMYRPASFGAPYSALVHQILRGESEWSVGERELFAAFTANLARCEF